MNTFFVIVIVVLAAMVVISLVRGIIAFLQTTRLDLENGDQDRTQQLQMKQNKMMFARIKYQALAIVAVAVLLMISR